MCKTSRYGNLWRWLLCAALLVPISSRVLAYTPQSPEVQRMVAKAMKYLETATETSNASRLGGRCLIGMAFLKHGEDESHPQVSAAIEQCQKVCRANARAITEDIYSTGIAILFLCDVDSDKYRYEIETLLQSLQFRQKPHGGWGYPDQLTGDTSMTQYGVLSTWTAYRNDIKISLDSVKRVCNWLLRTQDPEGGWGYQGQDPGRGNYSRVKQQDVQIVLSTAGLGSVYVCADLLGLGKTLKQQQQQTDLPPALKLVQDDENEPANLQGPPASKVDPQLIKRSQQDGNRWFSRKYQINPRNWTLYYMYALERYQSFRELAEGKVIKEPKWYNDGVRYLMDSQDPKGGWSSSAGTQVCTAFGVLFLTRSTKKAIQNTTNFLGEGLLVGGRGLPRSTRNIRVRRGRIVDQKLGAATDDLLTILKDPDHPDFDNLVDFPGKLSLSDDPKIRALQTSHLRGLVVTGSYKVRIAAVRMLARLGDMDNVPELIHALEDPDWRVVRQARDGLRFVSRKFKGFDLPDRSSRPERLAAIQKWKQWYLTVHPDAKLFN